jgi:hypothetical protein
MSDVLNHSTLATGLVSYWELEEVSGTRVDSHGSNDLTDNNTVGSGTGIQGNCANLEKSNTEDLSISDASQSGLNITQDLSFSGWFNVNLLLLLVDAKVFLGSMRVLAPNVATVSLLRPQTN